MLDTISHMTAVPKDPEKRARQDRRVEQLVRIVRESPTRKKAFIAEEEPDGVTEVTFARRLSAERISIMEWGFTAGNWNPETFQREIASDRALS